MCILAEYPTHTLLPVQGVLSLGLLFHSPLLLETQKGLGGGEKRKGLQGEAPGPGFSLEVKSGQDKSCLSFLLLKGGGFSLCFLMPDGRRKGQVIEKSASHTEYGKEAGGHTEWKVWKPFLGDDKPPLEASPVWCSSAQ